MSATIGELLLDLKVNTSGFKKQVNDIDKNTNSLTKSFGKLGMAAAAAFSIKAIVSFGKECLKLGSDLQEVQNVVDVTFGSMSESVNEFAKNALKSYGLSETVAKQYMGQFGAMSKAFGNTEQMAYDQAAALTALAGDVASFYNMSTDEAFTKLKSVYSGETESLKALGVVMTQAALDEYALQKGLGKTTSEMSEQEKVALRLSFVQDRLASASGDFARTSKGWANQTRVLALQFDQLKATLGQGFINVLAPIVQWLNLIIEKLQVAAQAFYDFTVRVFGDAGGSDGAVASAAAGAGAIADNMGSATKSAKEYKKVLAGFDKLNVLGGNDTSGSGGSGSGSTASPVLPSVGGGASGSTFDTTAIQETLAEIAMIVGAATLALGAVLAFTGVAIPTGIGLMALGAASLATAVAIDSTLLAGDIRSALDVITVAVSAASLAIGAILALTGVNMGLGIALLVIGAAGIATEAALDWNAPFNKSSAAIADIEAVVGGALLCLGALCTFSGAFIALGIALMAAGAVSIASAVKINWGDPDGGVAGTINTITGIVGGALLCLGALFAFTGTNIPLGIGLLVAGAVSLAAAIAPNWNNVSDKTKKTISIITACVGGGLLAVGAVLLACGVIPLGLGLIAAGAASLATAIAPNWNGIVKAVKGVFDKIGDIAHDCFAGIGNFFINILNGLIKGLNTVIGMINKIPGVDIKKIGYIPKLANGGYVEANTPQLAIIGDNKREGEIVAPESKIAEAVARGFAAAMSKMHGQASSQNERPIYLALKLGEDNFWEGFVDYHNSVVKRTGDSPLLV